jgi:aldose 1-epimerase
MAITREKFGTYGGRDVEQFTLTSETGVEVDIITFGVVVRDWRVPVGGGKRSVVLGFERFEDYPTYSPHFGALAGRVANRIRGARFEVEGKTYEVVPNEGPNALHGGPEGLGRQNWSGEPLEGANAVRFIHHSPDGAMGYPGNVEFTATYALKGHTLRLDLAAKTDRVTPVSLVQHQYFNLSDSETILDHKVQIEAPAFTESDQEMIPNGAILPVDGTKWDFRAGRNLRDYGGNAVDYDGNLVLNAERDFDAPVATVTAPDGSLTLTLKTDRPGLQFYNGVYTNIPVPGLNGKTYGFNSGLCLEDQSFADAVHHKHFPSILISPEKPYSHWCEIEIRQG